MLPFLISKTKLLPKRKEKSKDKNEKPKQKFYVTGDNLKTFKPLGIRRRRLKRPFPEQTPCDCTFMHLRKIVINYKPKNRKRNASNIVLSMTSLGTTGQMKRMKLPNVKITRKLVKIKKEKPLKYDADEYFKQLENQLKALNIGKTTKGKGKSETAAPASQRSKSSNDGNDAEDGMSVGDDAGSGEMRRRGKRRRKGRQGGSDRLTSAGLAAQAQQDPETQVAGIGTDSHNPSSRGSIAKSADDDVITLPTIKPAAVVKTANSFLDDEILKFLHREVDEEAIETEFDIKRRYVFEEALRTRPMRPYGQEMQSLLKDLKVPAVSLGDWLHVPRVFSRKSAQFTLPLDSRALQDLSPMQYAARFVTIQKSKQLLYLTVLRKFRPDGYRMPIKDIEDGLILMMGGSLSPEQASHLRTLMEWDSYHEADCIPDEIKLTLDDQEYRKDRLDGGDVGEEVSTIKYRTWCGLCAICERMYGRFPPREKDQPDGMELSDFIMLETKLAVLKVHPGLVEILHVIRTR